MPKTYTSDREWIKELLTYEQTSGSPSGGSHGNYGYNRAEAPKFKDLEEAVDYFVENDLPFIKEQYPGDIIERAKAGDYIFNTGKDPKIYAVNQYLNDEDNLVEQADLDYINSNRGRIKDAMAEGVVGFKYGDDADSVKINELYDKYVKSLPDKERIANLDDARNFYYQNTNVGSGSFKATWEGRTNKYGGYKGKQTKGREVTENTTASIINKKMIENRDQAKGFKVEDKGIEIPEGMIMNPETGDFEPDPNYVPPESAAVADTSVAPVEPVAPVSPDNIQQFGSYYTTDSVGDDRKKAFYERYYPIVSKAIEEKGIELSPKVAITQMGMESGWRDFSPTETNKKTTQAPFGVKPWPNMNKDNRQIIDIGTWEEEGGKAVDKKQPFVVAENVEGAVGVYLDFLSENKRYAKALDKNLTPKEQLGIIADAGYATNSKYKSELTNQLKIDTKLTDEIETNIKDNPNFYEASWKEAPKGVVRSTPVASTQAEVKSFQGSELNPNLRKDQNGKLIGGDKYVTKITDPNGVTRELFTDSPIQERKILGETFYSEKGGNRIFKLTDEYEKGNYVFKDYQTTTELNKDSDSKRPYKTIDGTPGKGGVEDFTDADDRLNSITTSAFEKVLDERLEGLSQKAKTEGGLTQEEFKQAKNAYDLKEGFFEKRQEDWKERVNDYDVGKKQRYQFKEERRANYLKNDKFRNEFAKNVLFPEAEKRMNAAEALQDEALQEAEIAFSNGDITKEQFNVAKITNKKWHKENDPLIRTMGSYRYNMDNDDGKGSKENPFNTYLDVNRAKAASMKGRSLTDGNLAMGNIDWIENEVLSKYAPVLSEEEQAQEKSKTNVDPTNKTADAKAGGATVGATGGTTPGATTPEATAVDPASQEVDAGGMVAEDAKTNPETAAYLDEDYLLKQNQLDQETIDFIKGQKEFNAELPEEESDYSNLLGNITDISKGIIGVAGAMEEVPEYQTGDMYNQATDDLTRMRNQGLSAQELDYMTGNAEKAFGYGMAQARGRGAAASLVAGGQQAAILQDQYGKIAAVDQGVRRQNMQNFVQGAVRDETINRQKFQDKFEQVMSNKEQGAALARDAYTNMNERTQFEKQYGKDSQYAKLMNEQTLSLRENREARKQSTANQKAQAINKLEQSKLDRQAKIDKYNKRGR